MSSGASEADLNVCCTNSHSHARNNLAVLDRVEDSIMTSQKQHDRSGLTVLMALPPNSSNSIG